ncbi:hypothetical protein GJAV_G00025320 [Gymnothorax javanicus]|nr:hypothetical protein GJAV_G00025320 [Gymnothorax javanicus]
MADNFGRSPVERNRMDSRRSDFAEQASSPFSETEAVPSVFAQREPLRQPRTLPPVLGDSLRAAGEVKNVTLSNPEHNSAVAAGLHSNLSANAAEFYPAGYHHHEPAYENVQDQNYPESLAALVQEILSDLSSFPESFESDIEQMTNSLNEWVTGDETLRELVELIFTQSTSIPNFSYMGARLCNHLSRHLSFSPTSNNFRQLMLARCHDEFERREEAFKGDEATRKIFHSYVLFLGELYLNLEVKVNANGAPLRADVLLGALRTLLDCLLSDSQDRNLICAVNLLKLTGSVLEDAWKERKQSDMDEVIKKIESILVDAKCSRDVRQMLVKLVELRSADWGRVHGAAAASEATPENDPNYFMNEPTFYTQDGTPFTAADPEYAERYLEILDQEGYFPDYYEENGNEGYYDSDEMEPEMAEAFESFCLESEQKTKR